MVNTKEYLKVCSYYYKEKDITIFYGYPKILDKDNSPIDLTSNPKSIRVRFAKNTTSLKERKDFPLLLTLLPTDYFITNEKTKDGKPILNKEGKPIKVVVLTNYQELTSLAKPSLSLYDLD